MKSPINTSGLKLKGNTEVNGRGLAKWSSLALELSSGDATPESVGIPSYRKEQ